MIEASKLPERYGIGKSLFYQRRSYLLELGYDLEPEKDGKSMTGTPGESIKKSLEKLRQRDKQKAPSSLRS